MWKTEFNLTDPYEPISIGLLIAAVFVGIVALNVYDWRCRRSMTKEARRKDDEENRAELAIW